VKRQWHNGLIFNRWFSAKAIVMLLLCLMVSALSAWTLYSDIPTGPYELKYPANFGNRINVPDNNPTTKQGVYLGRMLFYEPLLSANNKILCGSCHKQEKAFTDGKAFSLGVDGALTRRNSMSLANLLWTRKLFWDGRVTGLEEQAVIPMTNPHEMGQEVEVSVLKLSKTPNYPAIFKQVYGDDKITAERIVNAIAQFERTLISSNSSYDQYLNGTYKPTKEELAGMMLFNQAPDPEKGIRGANCAHCHGGPKNYLELFHNNGLDSLSKDRGIAALTNVATDEARFKVPTLRNIALTAPYMHDGRFKTLTEVIDHYSEGIKQTPALSAFLQDESNVKGASSLRLSTQEKQQLLAFLNMLTDSTFIKDPRFSNPFVNVKTK
jgi:cytochrome c peroxidase